MAPPIELWPINVMCHNQSFADYGPDIEKRDRWTTVAVQDNQGLQLELTTASLELTLRKRV